MLSRTKFSLAVLALSLAAPAQAALSMQDGYLWVGVSDYGTLGSNGTVSPGIMLDLTGSGNFSTNADFLTPGTPFEGFSVVWNGGFYVANNDSYSAYPYYGTYPGYALTQNSATSVTASGSVLGGTLGIINNYSVGFSVGNPSITIQTTLTNNSADTWENVAFLRTLDPDQDVGRYGTYDTNNSVILSNLVCATGAGSGDVACLTAGSGPYASRAGVSSEWTTNPYTYLAGVNNGDGDYIIGLAFNIGTLRPGESATFSYSYVLGNTNIVPTPPVPEPETWIMMLAGLALMARMRRRA